MKKLLICLCVLISVNCFGLTVKNKGPVGITPDRTYFYEVFKAVPEIEAACVTDSSPPYDLYCDSLPGELFGLSSFYLVNIRQNIPNIFGLPDIRYRELKNTKRIVGYVSLDFSTQSIAYALNNELKGLPNTTDISQLVRIKEHPAYVFFELLKAKYGSKYHLVKYPGKFVNAYVWKADPMLIVLSDQLVEYYGILTHWTHEKEKEDIEKQRKAVKAGEDKALKDFI